MSVALTSSDGEMELAAQISTTASQPLWFRESPLLCVQNQDLCLLGISKLPTAPTHTHGHDEYPRVCPIRRYNASGG